MSRVISHAGDSTDGEDYDDEDDDAKFKTLFIQYSRYQSSCVLKDLGNKILQSSKVREKYKLIKTSFTDTLTADQKRDLNDLDHDIGRGWGLIVTKCNPKTMKLSEDAAICYFKGNSGLINESLQGNVDQQSMSEVDKVNWYLNDKIRIQDKMEKINELNRVISNDADRQRKQFQLCHDNPEDEEAKDASLFLAKVKACRKLDKEYLKNTMFDFRLGSAQGKTQQEVVVGTKYWGCEKLSVGTRGGLCNFVLIEGGSSYKNIGVRTKQFVETFFGNNMILFNQYLQDSMKGKVPSDRRHIDMDNNYQSLATYFELIFGVETKRNSAALLTNAMYFDLVAANVGDYKNIENIHNKMPMAMKGAVACSVAIDKIMKKETGWMGKLTSEYDYRENVDDEKASILAAKDEQLLQTWLKWKLDINSDRIINYVQARVFYHLIVMWYGVKIPYLNVETHILVNNNQ